MMLQLYGHFWILNDFDVVFEFVEFKQEKVGIVIECESVACTDKLIVSIAVS